jgi:flagellar biogenesis protein FliO
MTSHRLSPLLTLLLVTLLAATAPAQNPRPASRPAVSTAELLSPDEAEIVPAVSRAKPLSPRSPTPRSAASPRDTSTSGAWWTTLSGLAIVLAIVGGLAWLARKHLPQVVRGLPPTVFEVLGRKTIEPRAVVHLVRCGNRILLLGCTPAGLTTLTQFDDPVDVDHLAGMCRAESDSQTSFLNLFHRATSLPAPDPDSEPSATPAPDAIPNNFSNFAPQRDDRLDAAAAVPPAHHPAFPDPAQRLKARFSTARSQTDSPHDREAQLG